GVNQHQEECGQVLTVGLTRGPIELQCDGVIGRPLAAFIVSDAAERKSKPIRKRLLALTEGLTQFPNCFRRGDHLRQDNISSYDVNSHLTCSPSIKYISLSWR